MSWVMVAVAAVGAVSSISKGYAEENQANAQSQIARNNAIIADQNAQYATAAGENKATAQGLETRARVGAIKAGQAASGLDVNSGSAADVRSSQSMLGMMDALTLRSNAARQAYGYGTEAENQRTQSQLFRKAAKQAPIAGWLGAGGSLLSGYSKGAANAETASQYGLTSSGDFSSIGHEGTHTAMWAGE